MLSSSIYRTAQHSRISPAQSSISSVCRSERDSESKHTVGKSQHAEHLYGSLCSQNQEIEICTAYQKLQPFTKQLS